MSVFLKTAEEDIKRINNQKKYQNILRSTFTRTIYFSTSMSATQINAVISALHKHIPEGHEIILQFQDGTYTLDSSINIIGFYGGGQLKIYGNASDFSLGTTKAVFLDFTNTTNGIIVKWNDVRVSVYGFKVRPVTTSNRRGIYVQENSKYAYVYYNYVLGTSITNGRGIIAIGGVQASFVSNYVSNMLYGIVCEDNSDIISNNNPSTGTNPAYGLFTDSGTIRKTTASTQPTGSTANELIANGGEIL